MLKQLLIVIFVLQSVAFNALAGTNMSQLNQAEITKMQIMHQASTEESDVPAPPHSACLTEQIQDSSIVDYCSCGHEGSCHSLLCNSIHTSSPIDTKPPHTFSTITLTRNTIVTSSVALPYAYYPPETPPPLA